MSDVLKTFITLLEIKIKNLQCLISNWDFCLVAPMTTSIGIIDWLNNNNNFNLAGKSTQHVNDLINYPSFIDKKGKIHITCGHFNFNYCPSCSKLADFSSFSKINSSDWREEYGVFRPSKKKSLEVSVTELERSPSPSPRSTSTGGKSRRRRTVKKYKK